MFQGTVLKDPIAISRRADGYLFSKAEAATTELRIETLEECEDIYGDIYLHWKQELYVKKDEISWLSEHDLSKLGYQMMEAKGSVYDLYGVPPFFHALFNKIDQPEAGQASGDGKLSPEEVVKANKDVPVRQQLNRCIVNFHSEWFNKDNTSPAAQHYLEYINLPADIAPAKEMAQHQLAMVNQLSWLGDFLEQKKGLPKSASERVWHMHPFMFSHLRENRHWCDPVKDPMSTNYYQNGNNSYSWGLFGKQIRALVDRRHDGLDLFAKPGTDVYACVDATVDNVVFVKGYGNVLILKVKDADSLWQNRKTFIARHKAENEMYERFLPEYKKREQLYLLYAHLSEVLVSRGEFVSIGSTIAKTGVTGIGKSSVLSKEGTCAPHLHFEVKSGSDIRKNDMRRCNPALFFDFKYYTEQSEEERALQKSERDFWYKKLK